jgi:hypothetical protein
MSEEAELVVKNLTETAEMFGLVIEWLRGAASGYASTLEGKEKKAAQKELRRFVTWLSVKNDEMTAIAEAQAVIEGHRG